MGVPISEVGYTSAMPRREDHEVHKGMWGHWGGGQKNTTCNNVYVGQSRRSINVRRKEHVRYIRTNNPLSAYALHILRNRHEYGTIADTLQLLKTCQKGTHMNC